MILSFDASSPRINPSYPIIVCDGTTTYICDQKFTEMSDGHWLINIDGTYSVRLIAKLSRGIINISTAVNSFECALSDMEVIACIRSTTV
ncbi:MAG: hypothetical protein ACRCZ6_11615 [Kluyvera sp.]|uniref:hypothetical protein n=1 Tax=Kluyvera sp. TaxID=1538228 RepID=UPI003F39C40E